ncbi:conserved exported protein of unknown function [Pseudodesulfovibrio profundus]|uniref:Lipoprotein n=1 Tax=Pseudodesulfovibrio profundus TaxID=57320 RepID=A0A2C8FD95_9BACT|nr:hypothetical protein [Pseudodesulfovibrio profundus]SOB60403.1 conserved exported protein of unknown function [Pseudodesulfovibrio profundus]
MNTTLSRLPMLLLLAGIMFLACAMPIPADAGDTGITDAEVRIEGETTVGQPVTLVFDLKGYTLPTGTYSSVNVRYLNRPNGPKPTVKTGYPTTVMTFNTPGSYRFALILNEIAKPSCGGVEAKTLVDTVIDVEIAQ